MSGSTSKEERRNFRKQLGDVATEMLVDIRTKAHTAQLQAMATGRELAAHLDAYPNEVNRLHTRLDGVATWCEQNETKVASEADELDAVQRWVAEIDQAVDREHARLVRLSDDVRDFFQMTRWQRIKWALFGTVPPRTIPVDVDNAGVAQDRAPGSGRSQALRINPEVRQGRAVSPASQFTGQGETAAQEHGG